MDEYGFTRRRTADPSYARADSPAARVPLRELIVPNELSAAPDVSIVDGESAKAPPFWLHLKPTVVDQFFDGFLKPPTSCFGRIKMIAEEVNVSLNGLRLSPIVVEVGGHSRHEDERMHTNDDKRSVPCG